MAQFGPSNWISPLASTICAIFAKISVVYNPFIYGFKDRNFRLELKKMLKTGSKTLLCSKTSQYGIKNGQNGTHNGTLNGQNGTLNGTLNGQNGIREHSSEPNVPPSVPDADLVLFAHRVTVC